MARTCDSLPKRFPVGSKYVVESRGPVISRFVEFPDGQRVILSKRMALPCTHAATRHRSNAEEHSRKPRDRREGLRATSGA
jgi:hypothetical protein